MIPNATQDRAEALLQLYAEAEEKLLGIIARQLGPVKGDPESWARRKLAQVQQLRGELQSAVDNLEKRSLEERVKLMWSAHDEGADGLLRELGLDDARSARSQASVALIDDANERFSELHRRILRDATDVYRDVLSKALPQAVFGVETTQQAVSRALSAFADRGITAFVDKAGRHWGMAEYAEMAVRTGMMNAALAGYAQEALAHGEDLVIVSEHADECPLCAPWERRVLSLTGAQADHPDCTGTVGDARAAGLFHPNCLHALTVYVPGLTIADSAKPSGPYKGSADARGYSMRQNQRYMERTVRRWKRRQAVATTPEEERLSRAYVVKWQGKLRSATADAKLPRKYSREGGRVLLSDAAKKLKPLKLPENSGIIKHITNAGGEGVHNQFKIDISKYKQISSIVTTNDVVITDERIHHIQERHPGDWEQYGSFIIETLENPDFILADKNPDTAICIKRVEVNGEIKHLRTTLRLHTPKDEASKSNSILTFQKINIKEYGRLSRNKKVIYRKE